MTFTSLDSEESEEEYSLLYGYSWFMFSPNNRFRIAVTKLIYNKYWEYFNVLMIVVASVLLAIDNPLNDEHSLTHEVVHYGELIVNIFFAIEIVLQTISYIIILLLFQ